MRLSKLTMKSPVFIVGPARSGTSILYRVLQKHPSFILHNSSTGLDLTESKIFQFNLENLSKNADKNVSVFEYMVSDYQEYSIFMRSLWWPKLLQWLRVCKILSTSDKFYNFKTRQKNWIRCGYKKPIQQYFECARRARKCARIVEKTPSHLYKVPEILATFPDARILITTRHPVDVYTSYRRRLVDEEAINSDKVLQWLKISVDQFIDIYKRDAREVSLLIKVYTDSCKVVMYEKFVKSPIDMLKNIFDFLDEDYSSDCMVSNETKEIKWEKDPNLFGEIYPITKDWREFICSEEFNYIQANLLYEIKLLGYMPYEYKLHI